MAELIVDFPTRQNRSIKSRRSVHFADVSKVHIVDRPEDHEDFARYELWYTKSDYGLMKLAIKNAVLLVRVKALTGLPISYSGKDGSSDCLIGIEHLITEGRIDQTLACRERCIRAVLQEQARQTLNDPSARFGGWEDIAFASFEETRNAAVRARKLGKLQQDAV